MSLRSHSLVNCASDASHFPHAQPPQCHTLTTNYLPLFCNLRIKQLISHAYPPRNTTHSQQKLVIRPQPQVQVHVLPRGTKGNDLHRITYRCIYIYIYIDLCMYVYIYSILYMYIYIEREISILYIYIYIYIYKYI